MPTKQRAGDADPGVISDSDEDDFGVRRGKEEEEERKGRIGRMEIDMEDG